jgi:ABC-type nitrate/sulfonate/bicarbonate transport system permease component
MQTTAPRRSKGLSEKTKARLVGTLSVATALGIWELYGRAQETNLFIPTFGQTVGALVDLAGGSELWKSYRLTLEPFLYGWLTALAVGIPFGLIMGQSRVVTGFSTPYLAFLNALPVSSLVPVVVIAFGIGMLARSTVVFLFAIVEVTLTTAAGVRYVDPDVVEMARSFGMGRFRRFRRVILPGSMIGITAAVRVGTGRAIVGMVVMELLLISVGVGKLIARYKDGFKSAELYAVVATLAVFGLVVMALVRRMERWALRWHREAT